MWEVGLGPSSYETRSEFLTVPVETVVFQEEKEKHCLFIRMTLIKKKNVVFQTIRNALSRN